MFDMIEELAAIHRAVVRDGSADTVSVRVSRTYDADADDVWDALTNPERLPRWFAPVTGHFEVGGTFQFEGNAGGAIRRCERPSRLAVTWGAPESVVDVRVVQTGTTTTVELIHSVPLSMAGSGAGALFVGPGWDGTMLALGIQLLGEQVGDPAEAENTPEVIEFNRGSIDRWTDVVELSGTAGREELAGARAAADAQFTTAPA